MSAYASFASVLAAVLATVVTVTAVPVPAVVAAARPAPVDRVDDYRPYFADGPLASSGWRRCPEPVTWTVDVDALPPRLARAQVRLLRWAVAQWSSAARLPVAFAGREDLTVDADRQQVVPASGASSRLRHVYVAVVPARSTPLLDAPVAGRGSPTLVIAEDRTIVGGQVLVSADYVRAVASRDQSALATVYLHELGHAFGLGHADGRRNVMHSQVSTLGRLGPGDRVGVAAVTGPCRPSPPGDLFEESPRSGPSRQKSAPSPVGGPFDGS